MKKFTKLWQLMLVLMLTSSVVFAQRQTSATFGEKSKDAKIAYESEKKLAEKYEQQEMEEYEAAIAGLTELSLSNVSEAQSAPQMVAQVKKVNASPAFMKDPNGSSFEAKGELDCPAGSQFGQSAVGYSTGVTSEADPGYSVYQYYNGLTEDITSITFWGLKMFHDGTSWVTCTEDPVDFTINFYGDLAGAPDLTNLLDSYTPSISGFDTGELFAGTYPMYRYTHTFTVPVALTDAWVMIQGGGAIDCWFLWVDSPTGTTLSYQDAGSGPVVTTYYQSICLGGTLLSDDVGVSAVVTPQSGVLGATEAVEVQITNFGANSATNFDVNYTFGGTTFTETYVGPIASGTTDTYTFGTTIDCSVIGLYSLEACTDMVGDLNAANDCYTHNFENEVPGYCDADATTEDEYIVSVAVGSINDGPFAADGITYHDYTATSTDLPQGGSTAMTVVNGTPYTGDQCTVWVDWNQDLDFEDVDEMFTLVGADAITFTGSIATPITAPMGSTRMRIRLNYTALAEPCGTASWGEVMDYSVNVIAGYTCPPPIAPTATNITTTTVDLGWTEQGVATTWDVEYGLAGFTQGTGTDISPATNPQGITGLMSGTAYEWYVRATCTAFDASPWTGPHSFSTACLLTPPPGGIAESEACGLDLNGGCNMVAGTETWEPVNPGDVILGTFYAEVDRDTDWFEITLDNTYPAYTVTINADAISTMDVYEITTTTMGTPDCTTAAVGLSMTVGPCTPGSFTTATYAPGTYWFWAGSPVFDGFPCNQDYWMEFVVTPVLCPDPTTLGVNAVTGTTADLTWVSGTSLSNIEYGLAGFTVGVDPIGTASGVTSPYSISGLTSQTNYDFYVQDDCGGGDLSAWTGPYTFMTSCATFSVPFAESFDVQADPACWTNTSSNPVANGLWEYGAQGSNPAGWGASAVDDHTGNGGFFAWTDGSTPEVADITLTTPLLANTLSAPYLTFYVFSNNADFPGDNVPLYVEYWDGAVWNTVLTYQADNPAWVPVEIDLSGYPTTGDVQFRFITDQTAIVNSAFYNDILIDDILFDEAPACPNPTALGVANMTVTTADLVWTSGSGLSDVEFGLAGFTIGVDPIVSVTSTTSPLGVTGLVSGTDYEFYVMDDCGGGVVSGWAGPFAFTGIYPPPANNDCDAAELIGAPYPVSVPGTTLGATLACPVLLPGTGEVWYEIDLPYALNTLVVDMTGTAFDNIWIVASTIECSCDINDYVFADTWTFATAGTMTDLTFNGIVGPTTLWLPVQTGTVNEAFVIDFDVVEVFGVAGIVTYGTGGPIDIGVNLYDAVPAQVGTITSTLAGLYGFGPLADGDYTLEGYTYKERGGTTIFDAVRTRQFLGSSWSFTPLQEASANVNNNAGVDIFDAVLMQQSLSGGGLPALWTAPEWLYTDPAFTIAGANLNVDMQTLASGDPDGSYAFPTGGNTPPGATCADPFPFAYNGGTAALVNQTNCGQGHNYDGITCLGNYDSGEDVIYELTVTGDWVVNITLDPKGTTYSGFLIADDCPDIGTCLDFSTNSAGTSHSIEALSLTAGTYYIMVDTWTAPDCIPDFDLTIDEWVISYCSAGPTSTLDSNVEQVDITGDPASAISHTGCPGVLGLEDLTAQSVDLTIGSTYSLDVTFGTCGGSYSGVGEIWIDWNGDMDFDDAGESIGTSAGTPGTAPWDAPVNFSITVPAGATVGATHMRIMQYEGGANPLDPCASFSWGSVMDFTVNVQ